VLYLGGLLADVLGQDDVRAEVIEASLSIEAVAPSLAEPLGRWLDSLDPPSSRPR
jgi:hypothetical protein